MRLRGLLLLALLQGFCLGAFAQTQRVPLAVTLNTQTKPDTIAWMTDDHVLWIAASDALHWGFTLPAERQFNGVDAVSLPSMGKGVQFDESRLTLTINLAATAAQQGSHIDLRVGSGRYTALTASDGLRMDYDLSLGRYGETTQVSGTVSAKARVGDWLAFIDRTVAYTQGQTQLTNTRTTLRKEWRAEARQLDLGSLVTPDGGLAAWSPWFGASWASSAGMASADATQNAARAETLVKYPSTADVYVNGVKQGSYKVEPGRLDLEGIRSSTGATQVKVVLRDIYGAETVAESSHYLSQDVVAKGVHEFDYQIGLPQYPGLLDQGGLGVRVAHRYGLSDHLVVGGRALLGSDKREFQVSAVYQDDRYGAFGAAVLASPGAAPQNTWGYALNHEYRNRVWSLQSSIIVRPGGTQIWDPAGPSYRFQRSEILANYATDDKGRMSFGVYSQSGALQGPSTGYQASWGGSGSEGRLAAQVSLARDSVAGWQVHAGVIWRTDNVRTAVATTDYSGGVLIRELGYNQGSSDQDSSVWRLGTRFQGGQTNTLGAYEQGLGSVVWRANAMSDSGGGSSYQLGARGVALLDGQSFGFARVAGDAAALVDTSGLAGVRIYKNGQMEGRTDASGHLWLSGLRGAEEVRLSLDDEDVPVESWYLPVNQLVARPAAGSLLRMSFDLRPVRTFDLDVQGCTTQGCTPLNAEMMVGTSDTGVLIRGDVVGGRARVSKVATAAYQFYTVGDRCTGSAELRDATRPVTVRLTCKD